MTIQRKYVSLTNISNIIRKPIRNKMVEYQEANREIFLLLIVEYSFRHPCGIVTYFGKK